MLAPSPVVKKTAKNALSDNLFPAVVVGCVFVFAIFIVILTGSLASVFLGTLGYLATIILLFVFVINPLLLGVLCFFRRLIWGQKDNVLIIFKYFSSVCEYKRSLQITILLCARLLLSAVVLFFPCIVVGALSSEQLYAWLEISLPLWTSNLWALNSFFAIIAAFALAFVMLKYYLAPFIFVSNDTIDPAEAVNMSTIISKRTGGDFFGLVISFVGWIALSLFVAPLIFTAPYFLTAYCAHCGFAITAYNHDVDRFNANDTPSFSTDEI